MNQSLSLLLLLAGLVAFTSIQAQGVAPTLSFGLDRVLFGHSPLDTDLLASIIADKQDDLKKRIVEKEILSPSLGNSAFVTQNYVYAIIKNLMNEKDKNILKKEVMEQTSNYALVYTLSEMYLQLSWDEIQKGTYLDSIGAKTKAKDEEFFLKTGKITQFDKHEFTKQKLALTDSLIFQIALPSDNKKERLYRSIPFNAILLDMVFQAVRSNPTFLSKGFCNKPLYFSHDQYLSFSFYHQLNQSLLKEKMYADVKNFVDVVANSHALIGDLIVYLDGETAADANTPIETETNEDDTPTDENDSLALSEIATEKAQHKSLPRSVEKVKSELVNSHLKELNRDPETREMLEDLYFLLYAVRPEILPSEAKEAHRKLNEIFLPKISVLNLQLDGTMSSVIKGITELSDQLEANFQAPLLEALGNKKTCRQLQTLLTEKQEFIHLYLEFFSRLDQLDKTETYYYFLKNLSLCGNEMNTSHKAQALNFLLHSIDKYTTFEWENDLISLDVESIILALVENYAGQEKNPFHLYLTIGANNSIYLKPPTDAADRSSANNFSYVSEKLGFRLNLINWQFRSALKNGAQSRQKLPWGMRSSSFTSAPLYAAEPAISNLHLLVFGSGLLSQLAHLTNSKFQAMRYMGTGLGLTFFNNLSVNTSFLLPIPQNNQLNFNHLALNVGFDVYFTQYLSALNKKRQESKLSKLELEKYKIEMEYRTKELEMEMRKKVG